MPNFLYLLQREIHLSMRYLTDNVGTILFFILTINLFPLAIGPNPQQLQQMAPGILWVCALLAALLPMERIFSQDYEDGSLDQLLLLETSPAMIAMAKITGHWLTTALPLILASIPISFALNFPYHALPVFIISLLLGTACLSLIGGMTSCIALGTRRNAFLLPLLTFPLLTPVLIFGTMTIQTFLQDLDYLPHLQLLGACFLLTLSCCPLVAGAGLKMAVE